MFNGVIDLNKTNIAKALVALALIALVFATGLYFGRTGGPGDFTVTTQYAIGAVDEAELEALAQRMEQSIPVINENAVCAKENPLLR